MKKLLSAIVISLMASTGMATESIPADSSPAWKCNLQGEVSGHRIGVIFSWQKIKGEALLVCNSLLDDEVMEIPVEVRIAGFGVGIEWTTVSHTEVKAFGIYLMNRPNELNKTYKAGMSAGGTLLRGAIEVDALITARPKNGGIGFEMGLIGEDAVGLGAHVHVKTVRLKAL